LELATARPGPFRWTKLSINQIVKDRVNMLLEASMALEQVTFETADHKEATMSFRRSASRSSVGASFSDGRQSASQRRDPRDAPGFHARLSCRELERSAAATADGLPEAIAAIWTKLVGQGVASLGCDFSEEVFARFWWSWRELGRAACPAPMWSRRLQISRLPDVAPKPRRACLKSARRHSADCVFLRRARSRPEYGSIRVANGSASGLLRFVEVAASCTHLVVPVDGSELAVVDLAEPGCRA